MQKKENPIITTILSVIVLALLGFILANKAMIKEPVPTPEESGTEIQVDKILSQLGKHILLPTEEVPAVAEITEQELTQNPQPFYLNAKPGDYLILYPAFQRAMIFDAQKDILVNVGSFQVDTTPETVVEE